MKRVIGITGGVGAGKSRVLTLLKQDFGARVILADETAHGLMEPGQEGYRRVVEALGDSFLNPDGSIDRNRLAGLIFSDQRALETMNAIIHPMAWEAVRRQAREAGGELVAVESALMGWEQKPDYDEIWYVSAPREERIRRLMENRGYSREKALGIMEKQASEEAFLALCDRVIDNGGSLEETRRQIGAALGRMDGDKRMERNV